MVISNLGFSQSLEQQWKQNLSIKDRLEFTEKLIYQYQFSREQTQDSIINSCFQASKKSMDNDALALSYYIKSFFIKPKSNVDAILYLDTAQTYTKNKYLIAKVYLETGHLYSLINEQSTAYQYVNKADNIVQQLENKHLEIEVLLKKIEICRINHKFDEGIKYIQEALKIIKENKIVGLLDITVLDRSAALYNQIAKNDSAKIFSLQALAKAKKYNLKNEQAISYNELGFIYEHTKIDSAEFYYQKAIEFWSALGNIRYLVLAQRNISRLYRKQGRDKEAKSILFEAKELSKENYWFEVAGSIYMGLAVIYQKEGDSLNFYRTLYKSSREEVKLLYKENSQQLAELEFKYDQEKNLKLINNQKKELNLKEKNLSLQNKQKNQLLIFLVLLALFFLLTLYLLYQSYINRKKITAINKDLESAILAKETLLKEIHHRVKNNFQMISSLLALQTRKIDNPIAQEILAKMETRIYSMSSIHQKLYIDQNYDQINASEFLRDILILLCDSEGLNQEHFYVNKIEQKIHFEQAIPLGIIVHELVTNSFKYAWNKDTKDKKIIIDINVQEDELILQYSDNGSGLPKNFKIKDAPSFGLLLLDLLIHNQLNGKLDFYNNNGANFVLKFKLQQ